MDSITKNRLDLEYRKQLCLLNFILIIGVGSIISLFIGMIITPEKWFNYSVAFTIVAIFVYIGYSKIDNKLKKISLIIKKLR
ncbi:MAG: hypothetical protein ABIJ14_03370 [Nanoarchaeota archaeon]